MKRIALSAAVLASVGVLALPATSLAFKFGAKLDSQPDNSAPPHSCAKDSSSGEVPSPCTRVLISSDTGLAGGHLTSPADGVITKFKIRAGAAGSIRFGVVRLKNFDPNSATAKGKAINKSKTFAVQGRGFDDTNQIESFGVNMKVRKGDYIGVYGGKTSALRCNSGSTRQLLWAPPLVVGDPFRPNDDRATCTLMVQAVGHT
jgi:hypothetical protein